MPCLFTYLELKEIIWHPSPWNPVLWPEISPCLWKKTAWGPPLLPQELSPLKCSHLSLPGLPLAARAQVRRGRSAHFDSFPLAVGPYFPSSSSLKLLALLCFFIVPLSSHNGCRVACSFCSHTWQQMVEPWSVSKLYCWSHRKIPEAYW